MSIPNKKVFISYAHKDLAFFEVFEEGLKNHLFTSNKFNFGVWEDSKIHPGFFWDKEIQNNLSQSDIAILCVSASFLNSQYIQAKEFSVLIDKFPETLIIPVYFNHCNINAWDDLSKRQFFKPSGNKYDKATKEDFAFCDLVGFIHTDGRPLPNSNIELYFKDLVLKVELAIEEKNIPTKNQENKPDTLFKTSYSLIPKPTNLFTGRKKELNDFSEKFNNGNVFCIAGLGGTGKSEFTAKFVENLPQDKVVWFDFKNDSSFESLIECAGYYDLLKVENKNAISIFLGFKELIERDEKIIFLDNYHGIKDEQFEVFFKFLKNSLKKAKFIFIGREKILIDDIDITQFSLEGLEGDSVEYAKKVISRNYNGVVIISDEKLKIICDDLLGHPFAIHLAIQLLSYEGNDYNILKIITEYSSEKEKLSNRLLDEIFNHPKSTFEEKEFLKRISIFRGKIEKKAIEIIYGTEYKEPLKNLINKLMITQKAGDYILHSLVREFSYLKLENKIEIHKLALNYYLNNHNLSFDLTTHEEIFYHFQKTQDYQDYIEYIEKNSETCLVYGYDNLLKHNIELLFAKGYKTQKLVIILSDISILSGDPIKKSLEIIQEAFLLPVQSEEILLEVKITEAEILMKMSELEDVLSKFTELLSECNTINFDRGKAVCLSHIGIYCSNHEDLNKGEMALLEAYKICEGIDYYHGLQLSLSGLGYNYYLKDKFQKAYDQYLKKLNLAEKVNNLKDKTKAFNGFALIHSGKKEFEKALEIFNDSLRNSIEIGDKYGQAACYYNIADILRKQKNKSYTDILNKSLTISRELFDYDNISRNLNLLGLYYFEEGKFYESIESYVNSIGYCYKAKKSIAEIPLYNLHSVKVTLGSVEYLKLIDRYCANIDVSIKEYINLSEIQFKPIVAEKTPGRNDFCTCGSGKKYKHCHGKK